MPQRLRFFERATKFYSALDSLALEAQQKSFDPQAGGNNTNIVKMAWERSGRLRLEESQGLERLIIIDGKTQIGYDDSLVEIGEKATYKISKLDSDDADYYVNIELVLSALGETRLGFFLDDENPLDKGQLQSMLAMSVIQEYRAIVLPSQNFNGVLCDLVRITSRFDNQNTTTTALTVQQETFWFSRRDGQFLRLQTRSVEGNQKPRTSDLQVTQQEPDAKFEAETFVFQIPKGAVEEKVEPLDFG